MAGAFGLGDRTYRSEDWSLGIWIPIGQVARARARPTAASHARAEFDEFTCVSSANRSQEIDRKAKPVVSGTKAPACPSACFYLPALFRARQRRMGYVCA